jgi:hypothetical protein
MRDDAESGAVTLKGPVEPTENGKKKKENDVQR